MVKSVTMLLQLLLCTTPATRSRCSSSAAPRSVEALQKVVSWKAHACIRECALPLSDSTAWPAHRDPETQSDRFLQVPCFSTGFEFRHTCPSAHLHTNPLPLPSCMLSIRSQACSVSLPIRWQLNLFQNIL